jgi:hypothetical protein
MKGKEQTGSKTITASSLSSSRWLNCHRQRERKVVAAGAAGDGSDVEIGVSVVLLYLGSATRGNLSVVRGGPSVCTKRHLYPCPTSLISSTPTPAPSE